jgi:imidazolonepropionase-like amidohydrolase
VRAIKARQVFDGERLLADGSVVLVDEGRIAGVQPGGTPLPGDCDVVDFPGATLLPGLIDAHVHLCADSGVGALDRLPDFSDEEMTAVIDNALAFSSRPALRAGDWPQRRKGRCPHVGRMADRPTDLCRQRTGGDDRDA